MTTLLLSLSLAFQAGPPPVTYTSKAKPIAEILTELSLLVKVNLTASKEASKEVVLISVNEMPLPNLLDKIATATACTWTKTDSGQQLVVNKSLRSREADQELQKKAKSISADIAKKMANYNKAVADSKTVNEAAVPSNPDELAVISLLGLIDPSVIASMGPEDRQVWATNNPTAMQRQIGGDATGIVTRWIAGHNSSLSGEPVDLDQNSPDFHLPKELLDRIKQQSQKVTGEPSKAILILQSAPFVGGLNASVRVFDKAGKVLLTGETMLDGGVMEALISSQAQTAESKPKPSGDSAPIEWSDETKSLQKLGQTVGSGKMWQQAVPQDLYRKLTSPTSPDPLSYSASDALLFYGKHKSRQVVADIPDEAVNLGENPLTGSTAKTAGDLDRIFTEGKLLVQADDGTCVMVRPARPEYARVSRIDRASLHLLLNSVGSTRTAHLPAMAAFASANPNSSDNPIIQQFFTILVPGQLMNAMMDGGNLHWTVLRLYAQLDDQEKQTLESGGSMSLNQLGGAAGELAGKLIFGAGSQIIDDSTPKNQDFFSRMMTMGMFGAGGGDFTNEPTEMLPNGVPGSTVVNGGLTAEPILFLGKPEDNGGWYLGANELAMFDSMKDVPQIGDQMLLPPQGQVGVLNNLLLQFHVTPKKVARFTLGDAGVDKGAPVVATNHLPADFQSKLDAAKQAMKNSPLGSLGVMMKNGSGKPAGTP